MYSLAADRPLVSLTFGQPAVCHRVKVQSQQVSCVQLYVVQGNVYLPPGEGSWTWWWWLTCETSLVKWKCFLFSSITDLSPKLNVESVVRPQFNLLQHSLPLLLQFTRGTVWFLFWQLICIFVMHLYEWKPCGHVISVMLSLQILLVAAFSPGCWCMWAYWNRTCFVEFSLSPFQIIRREFRREVLYIGCKNLLC